MKLNTQKSQIFSSLLIVLFLLQFSSLSKTTAQNASDEEQDKIKIGYLFSDGNMVGTLTAFRALLSEHPELEGKVELNFLTESFFDSVDPNELNDSDVLVLDMMNQQIMERYNEAHGVDLIETVSSAGDVLAVGIGIQPPEFYTDQGAMFDETAMEYWQNGGQINQLSLLKFAVQQAGITYLTIPQPMPSLDFGYYYPTEDGGRVFATWDEYQDWRESNYKTAANKTRVAIGFYRSSFYGGEMDVVDALIDEIETQGAEAIAFFGYPGHIAFERMLMDEQGTARADIGLSLLMRFASFESSPSLAKIDIPVINLMTLYGRTEQEWRESSTGLSFFEGTFQVAIPELAGLIAPIVVGSREKLVDPVTNVSYVIRKPIMSRISMAVKRGLRYARLDRKNNSNKSIALMYYNYPAGKATIGASYLNIAESLEIILNEMRDEGYDLGDAELTSDSILADLTTKARNIGSYAPGELEEMIAVGSVARVSMEEYTRWLDQLAPVLRDKIVADWGAPEEVELMTYAFDNNAENEQATEQKSFVIPRVQYGNIILMPQPVRGWGDNWEQLYHAPDLSPHHQYVAAYAWLRNKADVDAVLHMGTHGTLEWLDGKDMGLNQEDAPDALIDELPNLNIYNVDVVGEGLVAKRRGMATLIDHMVPSFVKSDLYPELAALGEAINNYDINTHKNPELADAFVDEIVALITRNGIDKAMGINLKRDDPVEHDLAHEIQDYLFELKEQFIPYGLHAFGRLPEEHMRASTVDAIVSIDRFLLPDDKSVLAEDMDRRIIESASREIENLVRAMNGSFISGGGGGEPIRNPDSYPTGKNFYGIDPDKVPRKASWKIGVQLADQMLASHLEEHGSYPEKVSFVIWGTETMRHEGVLESQIFHLLGTKPIWSDRDKVIGVEVVPSAVLGRPRIDIIIASAAEGMFNNVTLLMDQAVQKVKALEEAENYVRKHYLATKASLMAMGYSEEDADKRAGVRIFDEPPGVFNLSTSTITAASGTWDSDIGIANEYINKMGHGYGNGFWGEPMHDTFRLALQGVDKVVHSSSTMLYGALDNDDFFMYMGGLAAAVKAVDGESPELVVTNTRNPAKPEMSSIDKFIGTEFRTRYVNPNWIEGMQREGYAGARAMVEFVEYMWGWDATVTEVVDDNMWRETFEVYVQDKHDLNMKEFFDTESPYAFQDLAARMLETIRKEYWRTNSATKEELLTRYIDSIKEVGINCTEVSCGNPRLMEYVLEQGEITGIPSADLDAFRAEVEQAIKGSIEELAQVQRNFARNNDARITEAFEPGSAPSEFEGFKMEQVSQQSSSDLRPATNTLLTNNLSLLFQFVVLMLLIGWWIRRRVRNQH